MTLSQISQHITTILSLISVSDITAHYHDIVTDITTHYHDIITDSSLCRLVLRLSKISLQFYYFRLKAVLPVDLAVAVPLRPL